MTFNQLFSEIGISVFGSLALFCFIIIISFVIIMVLLRIPSPFILFCVSILSGGMFSLFGNTGVIRIILSIIGLVFGVMIGYLLVNLFYRD